MPRWVRRIRLAVVGYVVLSLATGLAIGLLVESRNQSCIDRKHAYDALHKVITKAYSAQKPSPAILRAFPQLKPLYTPGNPQYDEVRRSADRQRNDVLYVLGERPAC